MIEKDNFFKNDNPDSYMSRGVILIALWYCIRHIQHNWKQKLWYVWRENVFLPLDFGRQWRQWKTSAEMTPRSDELLFHLPISDAHGFEERSVA